MIDKAKALLILLLLAGVSTAMAREPYKCPKIKFSNFSPKHRGEAAPGASFSFIVAKVALPNTIRVKVKKIEVPVKVEKKDEYYKVTGQLPATVENTFARVSIVAKALMECESKGGWLLNITGPAGQADKSAENDQAADVVKTVKGAVAATKTAVEKSLD